MSVVKPPERRARNAHYLLSLRQEALRLVYAEHPQQVVSEQFGLGQTTLRKWLRRAQAAPTLTMRSPRLTPTQKHQLVRDLRDGRLTEDEALRKYGVRLKATLRAWVAAQIAAGALTPPPPAPSPDLAALPEAAALAAQLQQAQLQQAQWQLEALHALIDQAEATYRIAIRKKAGAKPSK